MLEGVQDFLRPLRDELAGRYAIEREIGRGGMALVYRARDLKHDRTVAIKVLRPEFSATLMAQRFFDEIRHASKLQHPGILPIHESGSARDLLFYVMPYVPGSTLRRRLLNERQLPIPDVLRLTREIADGLAYAHAQGIVHRDIKPENILLSDGHAVIADFGIARAVNEAGGERLTSSGLILGTPEYMSPEQCSKGGTVDSRSDVYSLACVVYEMLAGEPPFTGPNAQVVISRQMQEAPRSLRVIRDTVPLHVEAAIMVALAKVPADRFSGAVQFAEALAGDTRQMPVGWQVSRWRKELVTVGVAAAAALGIWAWPLTGLGGDGRTVPLDTTRYVILPFDYDIGVSHSVNEVQRLHDALVRWDGLTVADPSQVAEVLPRASGPISPTEASQVALRLRTGRFVRGTISSADADSLRIQTWLYNTADRSVLADEVVKVRADLSGVDSAFALMADRLLLRDALSDTVPALFGTRLLPARQAFLKGQLALGTWDLPRADSAFTAAVTPAGADSGRGKRRGAGDPDYAEGHLWVALVRAWRGAPAAQWQLNAEQGANRRALLSRREQGLLDAVLAQAHGELGRACVLWARTTSWEPSDFAAWYGSARCQAGDSVVLRDAQSPSGWRFRSSYHSALRAYRRAFQLHPPILAGFREQSYGSLRRLFKISGNQLRTGPPVPPDTIRFSAFPSLEGDSVAYVPYHRGQLPLTAKGQEAVQHLREQFRNVAIAWLAASRDSPDALEALAISLCILNDPAGLDTLRRARALTTDGTERLRLAGLEVWVQLSLAVPGDTGRLRDARSLADSILFRAPALHDAPILGAWLAALTGRADMAGRFMRQEKATRELGVPAVLASTAGALLMYSAMGGPIDSLASLERGVSAALDLPSLRGQRDAARLTWLARPATLAFATYRFPSLRSLAGLGNPLLDAQAALVAGDSSHVRNRLEYIREARRQAFPWNLTVDALCPEGELLVALGDWKGAALWLNPTLDVLPQVAPLTLAQPVRVASLVRAMALRARVAKKLGRDDEARRWARATVLLWSDADPFLRQMVDELRRLAT